MYTFRPVRAANATKNPKTREIPFVCIEGAQKMAAAAVAVVAAAYMMA